MTFRLVDEDGVAVESGRSQDASASTSAAAAGSSAPSRTADGRFGRGATSHLRARTRHLRRERHPPCESRTRRACPWRVAPAGSGSRPAASLRTRVVGGAFRRQHDLGGPDPVDGIEREVVNVLVRPRGRPGRRRLRAALLPRDCAERVDEQLVDLAGRDRGTKSSGYLVSRYRQGCDDAGPTDQNVISKSRTHAIKRLEPHPSLVGSHNGA